MKKNEIEPAELKDYKRIRDLMIKSKITCRDDLMRNGKTIYLTKFEVLVNAYSLPIDYKNGRRWIKWRIEWLNNLERRIKASEEKRRAA